VRRPAGNDISEYWRSRWTSHPVDWQDPLTSPTNLMQK
jgi:hypothetical protein